MVSKDKEFMDFMREISEASDIPEDPLPKILDDLHKQWEQPVEETQYKQLLDCIVRILLCPELDPEFIRLLLKEAISAFTRQEYFTKEVNHVTK